MKVGYTAWENHIDLRKLIAATYYFMIDLLQFPFVLIARDIQIKI